MVDWKKVIPGIVLIAFGLYTIGLVITLQLPYVLFLPIGIWLFVFGLDGRSLVTFKKTIKLAE